MKIISNLHNSRYKYAFVNKSTARYISYGFFTCQEEGI